MREWIIRQWHDISGNFKFWLLLIVGAAIMSAVAALLHGLEGWQQIVLVALFTLVLGWALIATFYTNPTRFPYDVTSENIESKIQEWLDNFGVTRQKLPKADTYYFGYLATYSDSIPIYLARPIDREKYITVIGKVTIAKPHKEALRKLSEEQRQRFLHEFRAELSRAKIHAVSTSPFEEVTIVRLLPITTLTEGELIEQMDQVHASVLLVIDTINLGLGFGLKESSMLDAPTPNKEASPH